MLAPSSSSAEAPCAADRNLLSAILGQPVNLPCSRSVKSNPGHTRVSACRCGTCCTQLARGKHLVAGGANRPLDPRIMVRSRRL